MHNYDPAELRRDFIDPLADVVAKLTLDAERLEASAKDGSLSRNYLPLNHIQALAAVARLRRFRREEVSAKLEAALEGSLRYRETELQAEKAKRAALKADAANKPVKRSGSKPAKRSGSYTPAPRTRRSK